jgi:hypothetical protein
MNSWVKYRIETADMRIASNIAMRRSSEAQGMPTLFITADVRTNNLAIRLRRVWTRAKLRGWVITDRCYTINWTNEARRFIPSSARKNILAHSHKYLELCAENKPYIAHQATIKTHHRASSNLKICQANLARSSINAELADPS